MFLIYPSIPAPVLPGKSYLNPAFDVPSGVEMLPVVEPNGIVIGQSSRIYNPVFLKAYLYENKAERELVNIYACVGNFSPKPDLEEVEDGRYWSFNDIDENLGKSVFTPNFEIEFARIRKSLEALL